MHAAARLPIASMVKFVKNRRIIEAYQQKREEFRKATAVGCPFYFIGCSAGNVTDPTSWGLRSEARTLRRLIHWTEGVFLNLSALACAIEVMWKQTRPTWT
jgi:hypothetical protein